MLLEIDLKLCLVDNSFVDIMLIGEYVIEYCVGVWIYVLIDVESFICFNIVGYGFIV